MADIFTTEKRSLIMSAIRGKNTGPELKLRRALHSEAIDIACTPPIFPEVPTWYYLNTML